MLVLMAILAIYFELPRRYIRHLCGIGSGGEYGSEVTRGCVFAAGWRRYVCRTGAWMGQLSFGVYFACPRASAICNFEVWRSHKGNGNSQNLE